MGANDKKDELSISSLQTDALNVFDFAKNEFSKELPIVIHGLSMGSLIATYVASNTEVDALILDGAIRSVPKLVNDFLPIWSKLFYSINLSTELAGTNNIDLIKKYNKPLFLLIGEDDSTTPMQNSQELFDISPSLVKVLAVIPNTEHGETMKKDKAIKAYKEFIDRLVCCNNN